MPKPEKTYRKLIVDYIAENRKTFKNSVSRIISDFQGEEKLTKAYDGRQLLEMLQNADDAGAGKVKIEINTSTRKLTFSNTGVSFSGQGIGSLMIRDLSTKRGKKQMIGNKGLGFRSILNWADQVEIISNNSIVTFSPAIAAAEFSSLFPEQPERDEFLKSFSYPPSAVPFPILGIPRLETVVPTNSEWATEVVVSYKKGIKSKIISQLKDFKKEILVFLNHISELTIIIDGEKIWYKAGKVSPETLNEDSSAIRLSAIEIDEKIWTTFSITNLLPDKYQDNDQLEVQHYNVCIAVNDELEGGYKKLFTYFPTLTNMSLPYLVHGTFELDPSRNYLLENDQNEFILDEIVRLVSYAATHFASELVDWRPYKLLTPLHEVSDNELIAGFYEKVIELKSKLAIYPCFDLRYRKLNNAVFHGNELSDFVRRHGLQQAMPNLYLPLEQSLTDSVFLNSRHYYSQASTLEQRVNAMAGKIRSHEVLATLIGIICSPGFQKIGKPQFSILLNREGKQISSAFTAFTPVTRKKEFDRPSYVDFDFIGKGFYETLLQVFELKKSVSPSRALQDKLKDSFNIQSYEPAPIITSYINRAKELLKTEKPLKSRRIIVEMVQGLFQIFDTVFDGNRVENARVDDLISRGMPLLSKNGKIQNNTDLVFGRDYPDGKLTDEIFGSVYTSDDYLAPIATWSFSPEQLAEAQRFFQWLRVGSFAQLETVSENGWHHGRLDGYLKYIHETDGKRDQWTSIQVRGIRIKGLDKILQTVGTGLSREQVLTWLIKDRKVAEAINNSKDKISYSYNGADMMVRTNTNYIKWQLTTSGIFKNYIIEDRNIDSINPFQIDFRAWIFRNNDIRQPQIELALLQAGALQSFDELPVPEVFKILNKLPKDDPEKLGRNNINIYKLALRNFQNPRNKQAAQSYKKPLLFAKKAGAYDYRPASEVYYADNHTLPQNVIDDVWLFNFPKRSGEAQIRDFFGTTTFEKLKPQIITGSVKVNAILQEEFEKFMIKARIFILAYRIEGIKSQDERRSSARSLEEMEILLVDDCHYSVSDNGRQQLRPGQFIHDDDKRYYFRVPESVSKLDKLKENMGFRDAFAEIFCVLFKVTDLRISFRNIIALGLNDTAHTVRTEHDEALIKDAEDLLFVNVAEMNFWKRIYNFLGKEMPYKKSSKDKFIESVKKDLSISIPAFYEKLDLEQPLDDYFVAFLLYLEKKLSVPLKISAPTSLYNFHIEKLIHLFDNYEGLVIFKLWQKHTADIKLHKTFKKEREKYLAHKTDFVQKLAKAMQYKGNLSYDKLARNFIREKTGVVGEAENETYEIIAELYQDLKKQFAEEWFGLSKEQQSLAFFKGHREELRSALRKIRQDEQPDEEDDAETSSSDASPFLPPPVEPSGGKPQVNFIKLTKKEDFKILHSTRKKGSGGAFDLRIPRRQQHAGKEAEKLVMDLLVVVYGRTNVSWVSGNSNEATQDDTLGYDIKYRENADANWILVEVKNAAADSFIISSYEVGIGLKNKHKYHLALIKDRQVSMVKDFFMDDDWNKDFTIDAEYQAVPKDWFVSFVPELLE
jgi:hypothetical protein